MANNDCLVFSLLPSIMIIIKIIITKITVISLCLLCAMHFLRSLTFVWNTSSRSSYFDFSIKKKTKQRGHVTSSRSHTHTKRKCQCQDLNPDRISKSMLLPFCQGLPSQIWDLSSVQGKPKKKKKHPPKKLTKNPKKLLQSTRWG